MTSDEFFERAREVHGDKYDYSECEFKGSQAKVRIICPEHGPFEQRATCHLSGMGCRRCAAIHTAKNRDDSHRNERFKKTMMERYGVDHPMRSSDIVKRMEDTREKRYGSRSLMGSAELRARREESLMSRYGETSPMRVERFKQKARRTCMARYGVHHAGCSSDAHKKAEQTCLDRFGTTSWARSDDAKQRRPEIVEKIRATTRERYGVDNFLQLPEQRRRMSEITSSEEYRAKVHATKMANGTFNTSAPEDRIFSALIKVFGEDDVVRQYSDERYPFACDFYIKSIDMFIEANISWTHGFGWFDESSDDCRRKLAEWSKKAVNSEFYKNAIETWTARDVTKRHTAEKNDLNYLVIWEKDASDFDIWLKSGCDIRKDWK